MSIIKNMIEGGGGIARKKIGKIESSENSRYVPLVYYGSNEEKLNSEENRAARKRLAQYLSVSENADVASTRVELNKDTGKITVYAPDYVLERDNFKNQIDSTLKSLSRAYKMNKNATFTDTDGTTKSVEDILNTLNDPLSDQGLAAYTKSVQDMRKIENGYIDDEGYYHKGDRKDYKIGDDIKLDDSYFILRNTIAMGDDLSDNTLQAIPKKLAEAEFLRSLESYNEESGTVEYKDLIENGWNLEKNDKQTLLNLKSSLEEYFAQGNYEDTEELARNVAIYEFITGTKPDAAFLREAAHTVQGFAYGAGEYATDIAGLIGMASASVVDLGADIGDWMYEKIYGKEAPETTMYGGGKNMKETWSTIIGYYDELEEDLDTKNDFLYKYYTPAKILGYNFAALATLISAGNVAEAGAKVFLGNLAAATTTASMANYARSTAMSLKAVAGIKNGMNTIVAISDVSTTVKLANIVGTISSAKITSAICGLVAETFAESITGNPDKFWDVINSGELTSEARAQLWEDFVGNSIGLGIAVGAGKALVKFGETVPGRVLSANLSLKLNKFISNVSPEYRQILAKLHGVEDVAEYVAKLQDAGNLKKADIIAIKALLNDVRKAATNVDSIKVLGRTSEEILSDLEEVEESLNKIRKFENAIDEFGRKGLGIAAEWYQSGKFKNFEAAAKELDDAYDALRKAEKADVARGLTRAAKSAISEQASQYINGTLRLEINQNIAEYTKDAHKLHAIAKENEFLQESIQAYRDAVNAKTLKSADLMVDKLKQFYKNANNMLMDEGLLNTAEINKLRESGVWGKNGELYVSFIRDKDAGLALSPLKINMIRKDTAAVLEHYDLGSTDKFVDPLAASRVYMRRYADVAARQRVANVYVSATGGAINSEIISAAETEAARIANKGNIKQAYKEMNGVLRDVSDAVKASGIAEDFVKFQGDKSALNKKLGAVEAAEKSIKSAQEKSAASFKATPYKTSQYALSVDQRTADELWDNIQKNRGKPGESVLQYVQRNDLSKTVKAYIKENLEVKNYIKGEQIVSDLGGEDIAALRKERKKYEEALDWLNVEKTNAAILSPEGDIEFGMEYIGGREGSDKMHALALGLSDTEYAALNEENAISGMSFDDFEDAIKTKVRGIDGRISAANKASGSVDAQRYLLDNAKRYTGVTRSVPEAADGTNLLQLQKKRKAYAEYLDEVAKKPADANVPGVIAGKYGNGDEKTWSELSETMKKNLAEQDEQIKKLNKTPRKTKENATWVATRQADRDKALSSAGNIGEALTNNDTFMFLSEAEKKELLYDLVGKENGKKIWDASQPKALGKKASFKGTDGKVHKRDADIAAGYRKLTTGVQHSKGKVTEEGQKLIDEINLYAKEEYARRMMSGASRLTRENFNAISEINEDFEPTLKRLIIGNEPGFSDNKDVIKGTQDMLKDNEIAKRVARYNQHSEDLVALGKEYETSAEVMDAVIKQDVDKFVTSLLERPATAETYKALAEYYGVDEATAKEYFALKALMNNKRAFSKKLMDRMASQLKEIDPKIGKVASDAKSKKIAKLFVDELESRFDDMNTTLSTIAPAMVDQKKVYDEVQDIATKIDKAQRDTNNIVAIQDEMGRVSFMQTSPLLASMLNHDSFQAPMSRLEKINYLLSKTFRLGTTSLNVKSLINQTFRDFGNAFVGGNLYRTTGRALDEMRSVLGDNVVEWIEKEDAVLAQNIVEYAEEVGRKPSDVAYELITQRGKAISPTATETEVYRRAATVDEDIKAGKQARGVLDTTGAAYKGMLKRIDAMGDKLGWLNNVRESGLRSGVYNNAFADAVKRGYSYSRAKDFAEFAMNNATTNFGRGTEMFSNLQRTVPFLGAAINGTTSFYRLLSMDPAGVLGRLIGGIVLPVAYFTSRSLDSKKNVELWKDIKEYEKDNSLVFIVDGQIMSIPLPQEISAWVNPVRNIIEGAHGANRHTFWQLAINDIVGVSPIDLDGFVNIDQYMLADGTDKDNFFINNIEPGIAKLFSQLAPVPLKATVMAVTGIDPYTMKKIDRSYTEVDLDTGQSVVKGDYSNVLSKAIAKFVSEHTPFELSAPMAEKLLGQIIGAAPVEYTSWIIDLGDAVVSDDYTIGESLAKSAEGLGEMVTGPITIDHYRSEAESAWKATVNQLYDEREALLMSDEWQSYTKKRRAAETEEDLEKLKNVRENLVKDYYSHVTAAVNNLQSKYGAEFTAEKYAAVLSLSTLDVSGVDATVYGQELLGDLYQDARAMAVDTLYKQGFTSPTNYSAFGYLDTDENGNVKMKYSTPMAILQMKNTVFYSDELDRTNMGTLLEKSGLGKNGDAYKEMMSTVDAIYSKEKLSSDDYDAINDIYKQWDAKVLVALYPYIEQRGIDNVLNDSKTVDMLDDYIKVPSDFMKTSKGYYYSSPGLNKQRGYAKAYLEYIYNKLEGND